MAEIHQKRCETCGHLKHLPIFPFPFLRFLETRECIILNTTLTKTEYRHLEQLGCGSWKKQEESKI